MPGRHKILSMSDTLERQLKSAIRGEVRFDRLSRHLYATDASLYELLPRGVVIPLDREDLEDAVRILLENRTPVLMRGGGTSLAGQTVNDAVVVDTSKYCNRLLELNVAERWARVQPGLVLDNLNAAVGRNRLWFPPDVATSAQATVGGMIGNNSAGARSVRYGMTVDHVLELDVMLTDGSVETIKPISPGRFERLCHTPSRLGDICRRVSKVVADNRDEIARRYPKIQRRVSGYALDRLAASGDAFDLTKLLVGSEGTLAVTLEAKLDLVALPAFRGLTIVHFDSLIESMKTVPSILATGPAAIELTDRWLLEGTKLSVSYQRLRWWVQGDPAAMLIVEYTGESPEEVRDKIESLKRKLAGEGVAGPFSDALTAQQQADVWAVRKAGLGLLMATPGARKPLEFLEDCGVPVDRLPEYVQRWEKIVAAENTRCAFYAHASVGVLHIRPFLDPFDPADRASLTRIAEQVTDMVVELGGSISGEHGDGRSRSPWLRKMYGDQLVAALAQVKDAFDPDRLLNPHIIVDPEPMEAHSRHDPEHRLATVDTAFDYFAEGGFASAIEMCNGQGLCRKTLTGTMCPSYMVLMEEGHSTRGRANVLRQMLLGRTDGGWDSEQVAELLDMCLSCKGCKGECPSNVDLTKLKAEALYQRYRLTGHIPAKAKVFGFIGQANKLGSFFAPLSNWVMSLKPARWLLGELIGTDPRRTMPPYVRNNLRRWWEKTHKGAMPATAVLSQACGAGQPNGEDMAAKDAAMPPSKKRHVVLFPDCFVTYNEPAIGQAAVRVLEAAGLEVILGPQICCGRAMLSQGLVEDARKTLGKILDAYGPLIDAGLPVVGIEPSCILTFRDELLSLHPDNPRAKALARQSFLIEEFLTAEADAGRVKLNLRPVEEPIALHGHCHAKALAGTACTKRMLGLIPGAAVSEVDSGCCGMAGAFGYIKGHYELSMAIGERKLFPAVRQAAGEGALVAAAGTSCRHQIHDGTGATARHPIQILADHLA